MDEEEEMPVVIDAGSSWVKAGLAGNDFPSCNIPSSIGSLRFSKDIKTDGFVGQRLENMRDLLSLRYPIQRGIVTDWSDMELLLSHCYKELKVDPKERAVLFAAPPLNPRSEKEKLVEFMFETFECPAMAMASTSCLCLYACGRNCGVMVNIGDGVSFAVPFYESFCIWDGIHRQEFAGQDITGCLQKSLLDKGHSFTTTSEVENVRDIKDKLSYTAFDFDAEMSKKVDQMNSPYTFKDGSCLSIGKERFTCMEALFQPSKFGFQGFLSIQEMIHRAIESCERDTKADILCNIILSGGTALNPGFTQRLKKEMQLLSPTTKRINVLSYPESKDSVWIGGSILGSLSVFQHTLISKQKYDECGPLVAHTSEHSSR